MCPWLATLSALRAGGYDGWCVIEAFGRALPEIAAATRVWRDFFPSDDELVQTGHDFLREVWAQAGADTGADIAAAEEAAESPDMPPGLA
jgi:D-psicose/D-tagatose/L-ribulose 3-epimerase